MSAISVRLPDSLHRKVREVAERDNVSINQMITLAVAEKLSALETEDYLGSRSKRGRNAMRRNPAGSFVSARSLHHSHVRAFPSGRGWWR